MTLEGSRDGDNMKKKFRAWDKVNNKMLYSFLLSNDGRIFIIKDAMLPGGDDFGVADMIPMAETVALMEYTDFNDRNGERLCEEDIYTWTGSDGIKRVDVIKHDMFYDGDGYIHSGFILGAHESEIERIGNSYENPELLEKI